jgi:HCOMODA/2-hydroxy-3-carboxy-muconic semialdehyde decarboxylase
MAIRSTAILGAPVLACGVLLFSACSSQDPGASTDAAASAAAPAASTAAAPRREQALLEDLALANRILARQLGILDIQGHATARSRTNPDHYYIARYISPGAATVSDFIENDLDSRPVDGPRTDQAREVYLHGEIYKARPDVMAIVHAHTPEFVAYGMSSVPLWHGDRQVPVWDLRPFNRGRSGIVSTPALGKAMAEKLGREEGVLLWGHGISFTGGSIQEAVTRVAALRDSAQMQQAVMAMGGTWKPLAAGGEGGDAATMRSWDFYKAVELETGGGTLPRTPAPPREKPADPVEAARRDLVLANRILAEQLGILGTSGVIAVRHPQNTNSYFVAPAVVPGAVRDSHVVERDVTTAAPDAVLTVVDDIYRSRPEVKAVLIGHTPEVVAFAAGPVPLKPVVNGAAFLGNPNGGFQMRKDGYVLTAGSIYNLVDRAYQLRQNAIIQRQAIALGGRVAYLNERPADPVQPGQPQQPAPTGPAEGRSWVYWSENVTLD